MSASNADNEAYRVLRGHIQSLEIEINWRTQDLASLKAEALALDLTIDGLRRRRTALVDAIAVHFPDGVAP